MISFGRTVACFFFFASTNIDAAHPAEMLIIGGSPITVDSTDAAEIYYYASPGELVLPRPLSASPSPVLRYQTHFGIDSHPALKKQLESIAQSILDIQMLNHAPHAYVASTTHIIGPTRSESRSDIPSLEKDVERFLSVDVDNFSEQITSGDFDFLALREAISSLAFLDDAALEQLVREISDRLSAIRLADTHTMTLSPDGAVTSHPNLPNLTSKKFLLTLPEPIIDQAGRAAVEDITGQACKVFENYWGKVVERGSLSEQDVEYVGSRFADDISEWLNRVQGDCARLQLLLEEYLAYVSAAHEIFTTFDAKYGVELTFDDTKSMIRKSVDNRFPADHFGRYNASLNSMINRLASIYSQMYDPHLAASAWVANKALQKQCTENIARLAALDAIRGRPSTREEGVERQNIVQFLKEECRDSEMVVGLRNYWDEHPDAEEFLRKFFTRTMLVADVLETNFFVVAPFQYTNPLVSEDFGPSGLLSSLRRILEFPSGVSRDLAVKRLSNAFSAFSLVEVPDLQTGRLQRDATLADALGAFDVAQRGGMIDSVAMVEALLRAAHELVDSEANLRSFHRAGDNWISEFWAPESAIVNSTLIPTGGVGIGDPLLVLTANRTVIADIIVEVGDGPALTAGVQYPVTLQGGFALDNGGVAASGADCFQSSDEDKREVAVKLHERALSRVFVMEVQRMETASFGQQRAIVKLSEAAPEPILLGDLLETDVRCAGFQVILYRGEPAVRPDRGILRAGEKYEVKFVPTTRH